MSEPILSREELFSLARGFEATEENDNIPEVVALTPSELSEFVAALLKKLCGEPVAWIVDIEGEPELGHWFAEQPDSIHRCKPLYALSRSK